MVKRMSEILAASKAERFKLLPDLIDKVGHIVERYNSRYASKRQAFDDSHFGRAVDQLSNDADVRVIDEMILGQIDFHRGQSAKIGVPNPLAGGASPRTNLIDNGGVAMPVHGWMMSMCLSVMSKSWIALSRVFPPLNGSNLAMTLKISGDAPRILR